MSNDAPVNWEQADQEALPPVTIAAGLLVYVRKFLFMAGVCYLGICTMLFFLQKSMVYPAGKSPVSVSESQYNQEQIREVVLTVEPGVDLIGWYCRAYADAAEDSPALAIVFPGNGGNRLNRVKLLKQLNRLGCNALIVDYRGYGGSGGSPEEETIASDSRKVWEFATDELGFANDCIVVLGQSLGGGVATRLVSELCQAEEPPAGLVLQATFTSLVDAAKNRFPWLPVSLLLTERYPSIERIPNVTCPLLVIHGRRDDIVPFPLGEELFAAAPEISSSGIPKKFVTLEEAGHNNIMYVAQEQVEQAKREFLMKIMQTTEEAE